MKTLQDTLMSKSASSEALEKLAFINFQSVAKGLRSALPYAAAVGGVAALHDEIIGPQIEKMQTSKDHQKVLAMLYKNYEPEKHQMLREVYGVIQFSAPRVARNYLLAKTLVDQNMAVMEQLSGSHPSGVQVPLPTIEQAVNLESRMSGQNKQKPSLTSSAASGLIGVGTKDIGHYQAKQASDPEEEITEFLAGLLDDVK